MVELIVIISIFAIVAGITLVNFGGFSSNVSINNLAYEIALVLRQTQNLGSSSAQTPFGSLGVKTRGVAFLDDSRGGFQNSFVVFSDTIRDEKYSPDDDITNTITIQSSDKIVDIAVGVDDRNPLSCLGGFASVAFTRPKTDAIIECENQAGPLGYMRIYLQSVDDPDRSRSVEIWSTGQISVVNK